MEISKSEFGGRIEALYQELSNKQDLSLYDYFEVSLDICLSFASRIIGNEEDSIAFIRWYLNLKEEKPTSLEKKEATHALSN